MPWRKLITNDSGADILRYYRSKKVLIRPPGGLRRVKIGSVDTPSAKNKAGHTPRVRYQPSAGIIATRSKGQYTLKFWHGAAHTQDKSEERPIEDSTLTSGLESWDGQRVRFQFSTPGILTQSKGQYSLNSHQEAGHTEDDSEQRPVEDSALTSVLELWDRRRASVQRGNASDIQRRTYATFAASIPDRWARSRFLLGPTRRYEQFFAIPNTTHWMRMHCLATKPLFVDRRQFSSQMSSRAVTEVQHHIRPMVSELIGVSNIDSTQRLQIRDRLKLWQEQHQFDSVATFDELPDSRGPEEVRNLLTRPTRSDQIIDADTTYPDDDLKYMLASSHEQLDDFENTRTFLRRGDLAEIPDSGHSVLAIYVREFASQLQFYTIQGKLLHRQPRSIRFTVPGFVDPSMVDELLPYLPPSDIPTELADNLQAFDSSVPREVGSSLIRKMVDFWDASEIAYRSHATRLDNVHNLIAHESETKFVPVDEIAATIFGRLPSGRSRPFPIIYAVHRAVKQKDYPFVSDKREHRVSGIFEVRPKCENRLIEKVQDWIRAYQELVVSSADGGKAVTTPTERQNASYITEFVEKARRLIITSRRTRVPTLAGGLGPRTIELNPKTAETRSLLQAVPSETFSDSDKDIIQFLEAWVCLGLFSTYSPRNSLGSMVLRATGLYEDYNLLLSTGYLFLQEIGVLTPWENRMNFSTKLALPGHAISHGVDDLQRKTVEPKTRNSLRDMKDTMQAFRRDWGQLEVFCVDPEDAHEIDDGISIERVTSTPSEHWVHIHVANPSAFLDPDHFISMYAAHLSQTVYFPERTYPMLPKAWTQARLSLAPHRPVLTFSARLNVEGKILEKKITSGVIHNVTYVTPRTLKQHFGGTKASQATTVFTVGGQIPKRHRRDLQSTLSKAQLEQLELLQGIGIARRKVRARKGALNFTVPRPEVNVYGGPYGMPIRPPDGERSWSYQGDPVIRLESMPYDPKPRTSRIEDSLFVTEMMVLASEVAAQWCTERNVPAIYRGTELNPDIMDPAVFIRNRVWPSQDESGSSPLSVALDYIGLLGKASASTTPRPHMILGVESYTKVTSPLRRYGDLVTHWQIEAALRHDAQVGAKDSFQAPFSKAKLDSLAPGMLSRERLVVRAQQHTDLHWITQFLNRAVNFKEAVLPDTFEMCVVGKCKLRNGIPGFLREPAVGVEMVPSPLIEACGVNIGEWWEVRISKVDTYDRTTLVEAIGLISRAEDAMGHDATTVR